MADRQVLKALTTAALALPGLSAQAQSDEDQGFGYRYSNYDEDAQAEATILIGSPKRYQIDVHQVHFDTRLGEQGTLSVNALEESMSGSSPWFLLPDAEGIPQQVLSGATIKEQRRELSLAYRLDRGDNAISVSLGHSDEDDYESLFGGFEYEFDLADDHTTLAWGLGLSVDNIRPSSAFEFGRTEREDKHHLNTFISYSRVINADSVIQTSLQYKQLSGFLSDPYKMIFVADAGLLFDRRPERRDQFSWSTRYRHYFEGPNAAFHADYRLFDDDWSVTSHTLDFAWHQNLGDSWQLVPELRYYSQSQAYFYSPLFDELPADGAASSDFRLSGYGALSGLLTVRKSWARWTWTASVERYRSDGDLGIDNSDVPALGLVDFTRFSVGFDVRW